MDPKVAARFDAISRRFDRERELVGGHFEAVEKAALERHHELLAVLEQHRRLLKALAAHSVAVDKRFEEVTQQLAALDRRFDGVALSAVVDKRFEEVTQQLAALDGRFDGVALSAVVDQRFEKVGRGFVAVDQRFAEVAASFEAMEKTALERHEELLEAVTGRSDNHEWRIRKLEGRG